MRELSWIEPVVVRDFVNELPGIRAALADAQVPAWVAPAVDRLRSRLPIIPCMPAGPGPVMRLPGHARSAYYRDSEGDAAGPVVAIKGSEPLALDFDLFLHALEHITVPDSYPTPVRRVGEHFAQVETKVPGALTLDEAEGEAGLAAELQTRHLRAYGSLAHVPCPLFLVQIPAAAADALAAKLRRSLSSRAFARIEPSLTRGLAAYVYYYPALPIRVSHFVGSLPQGSFGVRAAELDKRVAAQAVIDEWTRVFVRMLYLGYLPIALGTRLTSACCDVNNAVIDGGFSDLDSLLAIAELDQAGHGAQVEETLHLSVATLCRTVRVFLAKEQTRHELMLGYDTVQRLIWRYVDSRMRAALETEARPGLTLDPRVAAYFGTTMSYDLLRERLRDYYPPFTVEELVASARSR